MKQGRMQHQGFTLIEALFALGIAGILACLSVASLTYIIKKNDQESLLGEMRALIKYAKIQALASGEALYLAPKDPNLDWSNGVQLVQTEKKTGATKILYQWQWRHPHWQITWKGVSSKDKINLPKSLNHAISNGHFLLKNIQSHIQIKLSLNRIGRLRMITS